MKYEIEITPEFQKAIEQIMHNALLHGGANVLKDVNLVASIFNNLKEIK